MGFVLEVTEQEANAIFGALGLLRYQEVAPLITKLGAQINAQVAARNGQAPEPTKEGA